MVAVSASVWIATPALAQTTRPAVTPADVERALQGETPATPPIEPTTTWQPADIVPSRGIAACQSKIEHTSDFVVREFAAPLSALLRGDRSAEVVAAIERLVAQSRTQLDETARCLEADDIEEDDEAIWEMTDRVAMLRAFVDLFEAMARTNDTQASQDRLIDACNGIALYLDDNDQEIVESARFWQGVAYRRAGRPERTLQTLRPVLMSPRDARIGLLSRLERCRALSDLNRHAAALALAMKLEARLDAWFTHEGPETRRRAAESLRAVKIELLNNWAELLDRDGHVTAAANARREARVLLGEDAWPLPHERELALEKSIDGLAPWKVQLPTGAK